MTIRVGKLPKQLAEIDRRSDRILGDMEKLRGLISGLEVDVLTQLQSEKLSARLWRAQDQVTYVTDEVTRKAARKKERAATKGSRVL